MITARKIVSAQRARAILNGWRGAGQENLVSVRERGARELPSTTILTGKWRKANWTASSQSRLRSD
jgi:hypothetical protein